MAAADDDWVYVAEEKASDSDDAYSCYTSAMDDDAHSDGGWTEVNGGYTEEGGDDVVDTAACPVPEEVAAAAPLHGIKIDGDHGEAAAVAEDLGGYVGQATDAEAYYYGAYGDGYDGSYGHSRNYSGQAADAEKYYGYGYGGGNGDYYGGQATDADAYYGYGFSYNSYGSYGYGYGYGRGDAYGSGPAYGLYGNNGYNSGSARGYGYGHVQDGATYQQASGYCDAYGPTKPLEVRLRVPSWPPVFVAAPAVSSNTAPEPRPVTAPRPHPQPRARGITFP